MADPRRILIATPTDGHPQTAVVTYAYHQSMRQLERAGSVVIPSEIFFSDDLARARSRAIWYALQRDGWDYILWIDDDVAFDSSIVPRMIDRAMADGHHVLGAPYPRKRIPAQFPYKPLAAQQAAGKIEIKNDCVEVELIAFGFVLTSRECLETMCDAYSNEWFTDGHDATNIHETIGLFKQIHTDATTIPDGKGSTMRYRELYSEDYSFAWRWRKIGGKVMMYVGEGAPLGHVGGHVFTGTRDEIGRIR
jgi:hypothetical protein